MKTDYTTLFLSDLSILLALSLIHFFNTVKKQHPAGIFAFPCRPPYFSYNFNRAVSEGLCAFSYTSSASRLMLPFKAHLTINTDHCMHIVFLESNPPFFKSLFLKFGRAILSVLTTKGRPANNINLI